MAAAPPDWSKVEAGDHIVQYYEQESALLDSLRGFVAGGLRAGEGAVVILTPDHRFGLEVRLAGDGVDLAGLRASGRYIALDAADTLAQFMVNGSPEPKRFARVIGSVLGPLGRGDGTQGARNVRAFGEMVAILWEQGNREAAVRLEQMWNDLAAVHRFTLLCAYPMRLFAGHESTAAFQHICRQHSRVIPAECIAAPEGPARDREIARLQQMAAALEAELAARRTAEGDLAEFLDASMEGVHRVGPDGIIQWANRAELQMLGYDRDEYVGRHIADFHADPEAIEDILARLLRGEAITNREVRLLARDGTVRHAVLNSTGKWQEGQFRYTRCFTRDITRDIPAREAKARLAAIVESSDDAIISKDLSGVITSWNTGAERIFGYTAAEAVGRHITMLIPPDRLDEESAIISKIRRGEPIEHFDTVRRRKDGTHLDISLTVSPVRDGSGRIVGASKIARDITERKRAQQEREDLLRKEQSLRRELEIANADLRDFAHIVSHDLREPLRGISTCASFLAEDHADALAPEAAEKVQSIQRLTRRGYDLLEGVMAVARAGREELEIQEYPAAVIVAQAVEAMSQLLEEEGAQVSEEAAAVRVRCDGRLVVQALTNLIANALKYNRSDPKKVRVGCTAPLGDRPVFFVQDNGIGIDPRHQQKIFQMFKRLHPADAYGGGTGAGLAIVRKIVERHGGRIWVESRPRLGATFFFTLAPDPAIPIGSAASGS